MKSIEFYKIFIFRQLFVYRKKLTATLLTDSARDPWRFLGFPDGLLLTLLAPVILPAWLPWVLRPAYFFLFFETFFTCIQRYGIQFSLQRGDLLINLYYSGNHFWLNNTISHNEINHVCKIEAIELYNILFKSFIDSFVNNTDFIE